MTATFVMLKRFPQIFKAQLFMFLAFGQLFVFLGMQLENVDSYVEAKNCKFDEC